MHESGQESDEGLALRASSGDQDALEQLYLRHQGVLRAQVARHLVDTDAVHDIVQDAFIDLLKGLHTYDPQRPFLPWMRVICRNCLFRHLRQQAQVRGHSSAVEELVQQWDASQDSDPWSSPVMIQSLRRCLEKLAAGHREVLTAHYLHGQSLVALARQLGCTANALMVRVHRLRTKLKQCVQRAGAPVQAGEGS